MPLPLPPSQGSSSDDAARTPCSVPAIPGTSSGVTRIAAAAAVAVGPTAAGAYASSVTVPPSTIGRLRSNGYGGNTCSARSTDVADASTTR